MDLNYQFQSVEVGSDIPRLDGKIVVLGVIAKGIVNLIATPSDGQMLHQVQASLLETPVNGDSVLIHFLAFVFLQYLFTHNAIWVDVLLYRKLPNIFDIGT